VLLGYPTGLSGPFFRDFAFIFKPATDKVVKAISRLRRNRFISSDANHFHIGDTPWPVWWPVGWDENCGPWGRSFFFLLLVSVSIGGESVIDYKKS
jgi:hypothetical protein